MAHLIFLFWTAFLIGFSGAMMPGPLLTATISEVLKRGFRAGPLIVLGHALLEILVVLAVVAGLGSWIAKDVVKASLGVGGGVLLIGMGIQMAATARAAAQQALSAGGDPRMAVKGPVLTGILTSLSNPYWSIWWATTGLFYAAWALEHGWAGLTSFYVGHILSDLTWYSLVAAAVVSGRRICPPAVYRWLIVVCGVALVGLGFWFLRSGVLFWLDSPVFQR